ncbi:MAG: undecaprenyldiphospho-muramoylpentapeptide beta-N-acetylglucosaminyltransferase [Oligoflexia bacterium]|nr:undecaprenyldiphospho-muramoylpentapeptide beta-N-acetylglucosaminyltransferase [Oligoflexia bacterium]
MIEAGQSIFIAGGGTGGHIYPAIAVAEALKKINPKLQIFFIGTRGGLEIKIVPKEGYPLHFIDIGALNNVGIGRKLMTFIRLPMAIIQSIRLLMQFQPRIVLGVGGYASGPVMLAAKLLGVRIVLFEPNAQPGLTNRWLASLVEKAFVNFEVTRSTFSNADVVGIPIRTGLFPKARQEHRRFRILVFGGSQGARGINTIVLDAVKRGGDWLDKVEIIHQIGNRDYHDMDVEYQKLGLENVQCFEFLYDMPERYAWADLVVSRAGASTLAELAACRKASVLIPFPDAADNHQQCNAEALVKENAATMILQKEFTPEKFIQTVTGFMDQPEKLRESEENISKFFKSQSAEKIAHYLIAGV